ncbi:MAG: 50S ribosomal protein L11 methyltransferase [Anaerolineae bacterium]
MDWLEFSVEVDGETAEAVAELLNRYSSGRVALETRLDCYEDELPPAAALPRVVVKTYLPLDEKAEQVCRRLEEGLWHMNQIQPLPEPVVRVLAEEDWAQAWRKHYSLLRVGQRTVIVPAWEVYTPAPHEVVIWLEPGMAFGTGLHPTTRLCLQALERTVSPGCTVLDVGTGSGVLAIAAAKQGARSVLALDADPTAVAVAEENVAQNQVAEVVRVLHGTLPGGTDVNWIWTVDHPPELLESGQFDLVVINILASAIIHMAPALAARLAPGGWLIAAGLVESQMPEVVRNLAMQGLQVIEHLREQDWVALLARRT